MRARSFFAAAVAGLSALVLAGATCAQVIVGGGASGGGVAAPAVSPAAPYGTGQSLCVPSYSGNAYQWLRDSSAIGGETSRCHTTVTADEGHDLAPTILPTAVHVTPHLTISGSPTTTAVLNQAYAGFTPTLGGGFSPVTCSLAAGTLPAGMSLNSSTCLLSGAPTEAGTFSGLTIRATDAQGHTADLSPFTLTVSTVTPSASRGFALMSDTALGVNGNPGTGSDTQTFTYSGWFLGSYITANSNYFTLNGGYVTVGQSGTNCQPGSGSSAAGLCAPIWEEPVKFVASFNNSSGVAANAGLKITATGSCGAFPADQYVHVLITADLSNLNRWRVFINGVDMRANGCFTANTWDTSITYNMNSPIWLLNGTPAGSATGSNTAGWYSDIWVSHEYLGDASGNVSNATLQKFGYTDAGGVWRAVDLGALGVGPTGNRPAIYLHDSGDGVPIQDGSATGSFGAVDSWGGSVSAGTYRLFAAGYGPGAAPVAHRPTVKFMPIRAACGTSGSCTLTSDAGSIAVGDYMLIGFMGINNSGTRTPTCPTGWTQLYTANETSEQQEALVCRRIATSGDVSSPSWALTWTTGAGNYTASSAIFLDYVNVNTTTPEDHAVGQKNTTSSSNIATPTGTISQTQTLVSMFLNWKTNTIRYDPPSGCNVVARLPAAVSAQQIMVCDEVVTSGSYGRTAVMRNSADNSLRSDQSLGVSIGLLGN